MYQILIADDETAEREVIRFLLNKYHFDLHIHEAANGKEALSLLKKKHFDILFTDIKMPFIDGLTLASEARALFSDIQIIFFSGYDDFEYVKEALSLQVVNYILKPVNPEEFQKTITDVVKRLKNNESAALKEQAAQNFTKNHILYQLINNSSVEHLQKLYPQLDLSFAYQYHRLLLIQMEHDFFGRDSKESDTGFFPIDLQQLLPKDSDFINLNPSENLLLFSGPKHRFEWYQAQAEKLSAYLKKKCHMNCFIAISAPFSTPEGISKAYGETERILTERFFFTNRSLFSNDKKMLMPEIEHSVNDDTIMNQLYTAIQFKDAFSLKQNMNILLTAYRNNSHYSLIYIRFLCTNVLKLLIDVLPADRQEIFDELAEAIYNFKHFSEIETILYDLTDEAAMILEKEQQSPRHAVHLVKQYIHNHYGEDLGLNVLSEKVYLTPRYLSAMFIEETGCGINKYIKKVRMEKAQQLLLDTNMKVSEICHRVGYSNLSYFCKSFMEDFGTTPEKFRHTKMTAPERK